MRAKNYSDKGNKLKRHNHYLVPHAFYNNKWIPVYPLKHNDLQSGQKEFHYHVDFRFAESDEYSRIVYNGQLKYFEKRLNKKSHTNITNSSIINHCIKQKSMIKGKLCPHKGYDLSLETPVNGIITCPLHGLKFCVSTKKLLNEQKQHK